MLEQSASPEYFNRLRCLAQPALGIICSFENQPLFCLDGGVARTLSIGVSKNKEGCAKRILAVTSAVTCQKTARLVEADRGLMKATLSRILQLFVDHERRETHEPVRHSYCACGALKAPPNSQQREASQRAESRLQVLNEIGWK